MSAPEQGESAPAESAGPLPIAVRRARAEDRDAVLAFASTTWDGRDYIPDAWPHWIGADDGVLLVALPGRDGLRDADGRALDPAVPIAVCRVALLAHGEAWIEGIRVDPRVRGRSVATTLQVAELRWAAAEGARVVRYVTGERNEASVRLGARHGFARLRDRRSYGPTGDADPRPPDWHVLRGRLADARLLVSAEAAGQWWRRIDDDPTFVAGDRLYEHRAWTLVELTAPRLQAHAEADELLAAEHGRSWAVAVRPRFSGWAEDSAIHLGVLLASDAGAAARLLGAVNEAAGLPHRVRFPDPGPPLLGAGDRPLVQLGYRPHERVLRVLARPIDAAHPVPAPDAPDLLTLLDEPAPGLRPPPIG